MAADELAALVIREAGVTEDRLEDALQRQVLQGGHLDTVLLEMGLIDEPTLLGLLARAYGLPSVGRAEIDRAEPAAISMFPRRLAEKHGIIPLALDGRRLTVAVADAPDLALLDEIGFMLSVYVRPCITPEARVAYALYRLYGVPLPARIENLLGLLGEDPEDVPPLHADAASTPVSAPPSSELAPSDLPSPEPLSSEPPVDGEPTRDEPARDAPEPAAWEVGHGAVDADALAVHDGAEPTEEGAPATAIAPLFGAAPTAPESPTEEAARVHIEPAAEAAVEEPAVELAAVELAAVEEPASEEPAAHAEAPAAGLVDERLPEEPPAADPSAEPEPPVEGPPVKGPPVEPEVDEARASPVEDAPAPALVVDVPQLANEPEAAASTVAPELPADARAPDAAALVIDVDERARQEARERLLARLDAEDEAEARREQERREQRVRWTVDDAIAELALAGERDQMLDVVLRFAYRRLRTAAILVVQRLPGRDGAVVPSFVGWDIIDPELGKKDVARLTISVEGDHALAQLWQIRSHFLGPLREDDPLRQALGRAPRAVVLVPIRVGDALAGVLYGDCGERAIPPSSLAELHMVVPRLGKALRNLILRHKTGAAPAPESAPRADVTPRAAEVSIPVIDLEMDDFDVDEPTADEPTADALTGDGPAVARPGVDEPEDGELDVEIAVEHAAIHEPVAEIDAALERIEATSSGSFARAPLAASDVATEVTDRRPEPAARPQRPKPPPLPIRVRDALVVELHTDEGDPIVDEQPRELPSVAAPTDTSPRDSEEAEVDASQIEEMRLDETRNEETRDEEVQLEDPSSASSDVAEAVAVDVAPINEAAADEEVPTDDARADEALAAAQIAAASAPREEPPAPEPTEPTAPTLEAPLEAPAPSQLSVGSPAAHVPGPEIVVGSLLEPAAVGVDPGPAVIIGTPLTTRLTVATSPGASARESVLLATWKEWLEHEDAEADELVGNLHQPGEAGRAAVTQVCALGERAMPALARYFPGVLSAHPFSGMESRPDVTEFSDACSCLVRLGPDLAAPILVGELAHDDRLHRFTAVWALSEVHVPAALPRLAQRVFDPELRIALLALEVLEAYRALPSFPKVLSLLRDLCRRGDTFQRMRAIMALAELRDRDALDVLASLLGTRPKDIAEEARRALVAITRQDFRQSERRWRAWIADNGKLPRMRWLIDALGHKEAELREAAQLELNRLTGKNFGYRSDAARKDREASIQAWLEWWSIQDPDAWA